tara:strand:+ start:480 stop:635 length:156 start_codon:yes stop_codon:yes gene_type:complete
MNEYVGLFLLTLLWLSISFIIFRYVKNKYKKKPFNIKKVLDRQDGGWPDGL